MNKKMWPTNLTTTNFTLPSSAAPSSIEVRILVDNSMVEVFVAKGRGVITQSLLSRAGLGGGTGVYFMGGGHGPATIMQATAWDMGWEPCIVRS